ncbi:hypothetical protein KC717_05105, partial [Candidatus Dojkabacteria bacterium]|nr:hypothetical protein [Candidatus Dojkabacteria bacterium]
MIYYVIPKLIQQPTWGGSHIPETKGLSVKERIGQSYEFWSGSKLVPMTELDKVKVDKMPYLIGSNDVEDEKLVNKVKGIIDFEKLNLKEVFGRRRVPEILIKFTQAKGNSYQIHSKFKSGDYLPKQESWYFFAKGKITLGLREGVDVKQYQAICESIYEKTQELSKAVQKKKMKVDDARLELKRFIELNNPEQFVNVLTPEADTIVSNTIGGIHHSWEEDNTVIPDGNIVFEVQQDVSD